jgi:hypothetical protein
MEVIRDFYVNLFRFYLKLYEGHKKIIVIISSYGNGENLALVMQVNFAMAK